MLETRRYERLGEDLRVCPFCNVIENEIHVYDDLKINILGKALEIVPHLNSLTDEQKLVVLFSVTELVRICAKTCAMILQRMHFLISYAALTPRRI